MVIEPANLVVVSLCFDPIGFDSVEWTESLVGKLWAGFLERPFTHEDCWRIFDIGARVGFTKRSEESRLKRD